MTKYEKIAKWIIDQEVDTPLKDSDIKEIGKLVFDSNLSTKEIKMIKDKLAENKYFNFKDCKRIDFLRKLKSYANKSKEEIGDYNKEVEDILDEAYDNLSKEDYFKLEKWVATNIYKENINLKDSRKAVITVWLKNKNSKNDLDNICNSLNTKYKILKETPTDLRVELKGDIEGVVDDLRSIGIMSTSLNSVEYKDKKFKDSEKYKLVLKDEWKAIDPKEYIGRKGIFLCRSDYFWEGGDSSDYEEISKYKGKKFTIVGCTCDNDTFEDSDWDIKFDDGKVIEAMSGYELKLLNKLTNSDKDISTIKDVKPKFYYNSIDSSEVTLKDIQNAPYGKNYGELRALAKVGIYEMTKLGENYWEESVSEIKPKIMSDKELYDMLKAKKGHISIPTKELSKLLNDAKLTHKQKLWYAEEIEKFIEPKYLKKNYTLKKIKRKRGK